MSSAASRQWNHTVAAGLTNGILVVFLTSGSGTLRASTGVVWDQGGANTAMTFLGKINDSNNNCYTEIWYLKNPASGTKAIKASYAVTVEITAGSASYQFVNQTTPWNAASPQTNSGATQTSGTDTVTSATHEMVVGCCVENGGTALSNSAGQTVIHNDNIGAGNHAGTSSDKAGAASVVLTVTGITSGNAWAFIGGSLQFDGGGGGGATRRRIRLCT